MHLPPTSDLSRTARRARTLRATAWYMLGVAVLFFVAIVIFLPDNKLRGLVLLLGVGGTSLLTLILLHWNKVTLAGIGYLSFLWVLTSVFATTGGGAISPAFAGFLCLTLTAGLLFGVRGGLVMMVVCLLSEAAIIYGGFQGILPPNQIRHTPASMIATHAIFLGWVSIIVLQYTRAIESVADNLKERVKELSLLHATSQKLHAGTADTQRILEALADMLPNAYTHPEHAAARVLLGDLSARSAGFKDSSLRQTSVFTTSDGRRGVIEVVYLPEDSGKTRNLRFFPEEQALIDTLADMLRVAHERHATLNALQESEARLRELFDTVLDTVYQLAPDGTIISLNPAFGKSTGWAPEEWIGRNFSELVHPDDLNQVRVNFRTTLTGNAPVMYELRIRTRSGDHIVCEVLGVPRRANGTVAGVLGISRDITERRRMEDAIQRAQRMESVGTLASGIAHDLNNVLTPILLISSMLERRLQDEKGRKLAGSISSAAARGSDILRNILAFARGDGGGVRTLQPNEVVLEMAALLKDSFPRSISIDFRIPDDTPMILGDPTQIHQVLMNLCVNARDAMPEGGRLEVSLATEVVDESTAAGEASRPGKYVVLTVSDTGSGIPPEIQSRIFEPFFTTKGVEQGTGLGLSNTMSIVRAHGGFVHVSSDPGKGTTFRVYLPQVGTGPYPSEQAAARVHVGQGEHILVVEDEQASLYFIREVLEANGYAVRIARNGNEAIRIFEDIPPGVLNLVIADTDMPGMDGVTVRDTIHARDARVRFLLISGNPGGILKAKASHPGEFLAKPFSANELLNRVESALRG